jgi:hypothetical protein
MLNDVEQITGFDRDHHGLEGNASLNLKDLVLAWAPAKGLHGKTIRPCVPFVITIGRRTGAARQNPQPGWLQPPRAHARRKPSRGDGLTGRPTPNLARSPGSRQHHSMANSPSAALLRLRALIAERRRMRPIDQPLML